MSTKILPLAVLDKCIGSNIWILMKSRPLLIKGQREFAGVLKGFDDFFNMVLETVT
jgi:U6 snRNA-associated Sm-like protein LSm5